MTDQSDSPETDDVRRLLAEARHTAPIPDDVAKRLDTVLADLGRTSAAPASGSPDVPPSAGAQPVSLAAHRRRKAAGLLVAAAAIVVGGVVVAQQLPRDGSSSATTAGSATGDSALDNGSLGPERHQDANVRPGTKSPPAQTRQGRLVVRPQHFSADALAGRALAHTKAYSAQSDEVSACVDAPRHSRLVRAVFRRAPAVLVYHRPAGSTQVVDLFVCGSSRPLKSVTLPTD